MELIFGTKQGNGEGKSGNAQRRKRTAKQGTGKERPSIEIIEMHQIMADMCQAVGKMFDQSRANKVEEFSRCLHEFAEWIGDKAGIVKEPEFVSSGTCESCRHADITFTCHNPKSRHNWMTVGAAESCSGHQSRPKLHSLR